MSGTQHQRDVRQGIPVPCQNTHVNISCTNRLLQPLLASPPPGDRGAKTLTPLRRHPYPLLHPLVASRGRRRTKPGGAGEGGGGALDPLGSQHPDLEGGRLAGYRRSAAARRHDGTSRGKATRRRRWAAGGGGAGGEWRRRGYVLGPIWAQRAAASARVEAARWPQGAARGGGSVEVMLVAAGGEGCEGGAGSSMASGALACPCCQRQGLDLVPLGPEDGSRCTHCLLGSADAEDEWHGRCCILPSFVGKRKYNANGVARLAMQCRQGQEVLSSEVCCGER
jgi:hypothetical protein